jgi:murein DD-endopeptidase MepM/ murein hydrolase activator NlpD
MNRGGRFLRRPEFRSGGPAETRFRRLFLVGGAGAAAVLILAGLLIFRFSGGRVAEKIGPGPAAEKTEPRPAARPPAKPEVELIPPGTTLSALLARHGFSAEESYALWREVRPVFDMQKLIAGRELRLSKDAAGKVQSIEYDLDDRRYLHIERVGKRFLPGIENYRFETRIAFAAGIIEDILINAMDKTGEKLVLALAMADLLAWDIDFNTELRIGDSFRLLFEKNFREGQFAGYGEILAVEFLCQGRRYDAYRFVYPDTGESDHFDAEGRSTRKEFLRAPIPFAPITSRFSANRLHPIFKVYRAHYGVDYGAPIGTAVQATADGVVTAAGWNGGAGQMVRLRHANSYETMYLHLSRILVNVGDRVKMGQAIGRVGSTGESTGPHLDYRILQGGTFINPLGKRFDPVAPLRKEFTAAFKGEVEKYRVLLGTPFHPF